MRGNVVGAHVRGSDMLALLFDSSETNNTLVRAGPLTPVREVLLGNEGSRCVYRAYYFGFLGHRNCIYCCLKGNSGSFKVHAGVMRSHAAAI